MTYNLLNNNYKIYNNLLFYKINNYKIYNDL